MMQKGNFNVLGLEMKHDKVVCGLLTLFFFLSQEKTDVSLLVEKLSQLFPLMQ